MGFTHAKAQLDRVPHSLPSVLRILIAAVVVLLVLGCTDATGPYYAAELAMSTATPGLVRSGIPFPLQPVVHLEDAGGHDVQQPGITVTASLAGSAGALTGTTSVQTNSSGRAIFTDLAVTGSGVQTLQFASSGLRATTDSVVLPMPLANRVAIAGINGGPGTTAWYTIQIGEGVSQLTIDAAGSLGMAKLYVRFGALPSATIADCPSVWPLPTDHCVFTNPAAGTYYVLLLGTNTYSSWTLNASWQTPTMLAVATQPADTARSGIPLSRQPVVQVLDGAGAPLRHSDLAIGAFVTSGAVVLGGATTVLTDSNGVAVFTDLSLTGAGAYAIQFRATGVTPVTSTIVTLPSTLLSSTPDANLFGLAGSSRWYVVVVSPGTASLVVTSSGGTGNPDLFVRFDALPTTATSDCSSTGPGSTERCDIPNPAPGSWYVLLNGTGAYSGVSIAVPTGTQCTLTTPGDRDGDGLPDCVETNTGVYVSPTNTGTDPDNPDTDGDGISDGDEVLGTAQGLDLPAMGVNPLRRDLLVEYDWFDDANDCGPHSHRPTPAAIARVTAAFASDPQLNRDGSTGINLISDYGQGGPFTGGNLIADADGVIDQGVGGTDFNAYKAANFQSNRVGYFHYVLMPHRYLLNSSSSGQAELPGRDMIVSLYCANSDVNVANTIMHELGHNLGLRHGGIDDFNWKPNYNSVMNYRFQFAGIDDRCTPLGDGILGYSLGNRPPLDENHLNETQGVCGTPPGPGWDWNANGESVDTGIAVDINVDLSGVGDGLLTVLVDFDDWAHLNFGGSGGITGAAQLRAAPQIISCVHDELKWVR